MTAATATLPGVAALSAISERDDGELLALLHESGEGDEARAAACEVLVSRYESLVRSCVYRYRDTPEMIEDLMQVGVGKAGSGKSGRL